MVDEEQPRLVKATNFITIMYFAIPQESTTTTSGTKQARQGIRRGGLCVVNSRTCFALFALYSSCAQSLRKIILGVNSTSRWSQSTPHSPVHCRQSFNQTIHTTDSEPNTIWLTQHPEEAVVEDLAIEDVETEAVEVEVVDEVPAEVVTSPTRRNGSQLPSLVDL